MPLPDFGFLVMKTFGWPLFFTGCLPRVVLQSCCSAYTSKSQGLFCIFPL